MHRVCVYNAMHNEPPFSTCYGMHGIRNTWWIRRPQKNEKRKMHKANSTITTASTVAVANTRFHGTHSPIARSRVCNV